MIPVLPDAKIVAYLVAAVGAVYLLHRLALWLESRGWLFNLKRKPSSSSVGNAFLEVQAMVEPQKQHVLEIKREEQTERAESGDPPLKPSHDRPPF